MGRLKKYATKPSGTKSKQVTTKLTEKEYQDFIDYIKPLGLKPSVALRYLIREEIYSDQANSNKQTSADKETKSKPKKLITHPIGSNKQQNITQKKIKVDPRKSSGYLSKFRVNGKLPCPTCEAWFSAGHYKKRHAEKHDGLTSEEFLRKYEEKAMQMVADYQEDNL